MRLDLFDADAKAGIGQRQWAAVKVALSILIILVTSALVGLKVLNIFNISLDAFRIVGGVIIAYMGFDMLSGRHVRGCRAGITAPAPDSQRIEAFNATSSGERRERNGKFREKMRTVQSPAVCAREAPQIVFRSRLTVCGTSANPEKQA